MSRRALPIGIQTFREIHEKDYYYVDKTGFALPLANEGQYYFLSRPRRFGKSLFLDTLAELFAGNAGLFQGLGAEQRWDWTWYPKTPVIMAASTCACASTARSGCSSLKWSSSPPKAGHWLRSRPAVMRTNTAPRACPSTFAASTSADRSAPW